MLSLYGRVGEGYVVGGSGLSGCWKGVRCVLGTRDPAKHLWPRMTHVVYIRLFEKRIRVFDTRRAPARPRVAPGWPHAAWPARRLSGAATRFLVVRSLPASLPASLPELTSQLP